MIKVTDLFLYRATELINIIRWDILTPTFWKQIIYIYGNYIEITWRWHMAKEVKGINMYFQNIHS